MKKTLSLLILLLISIYSYAQQATEIDPKFVKLPRYADLTAVNAIPLPQQGMMVYNNFTKSNWYHDGTSWKDMAVASVSIPSPLYLNSTSTTITGETNQADESGVLGVNTSDGVAYGVIGRISNTNSDEEGTGVLGENKSLNGLGYGVKGTHDGTGWAGHFLGYNALKTQGYSLLDGPASISNSNYLEFGKGISKQEDNGKIAYHAFGEANTLSIVGGGTENDGSDRKIKMWADAGTEFTGSISTTGEIKPNGSSGSVGQVLSNNGNGTMAWITSNNSNTDLGFGSWGGCEYPNIDAYNPATGISPQPNDYFGLSVSLSGDYAIIGAPNTDVGAIEDVGCVTIFKRNSVSKVWEQNIKLNNMTISSYQLFGSSVSISGDYLVIGVPEDDEVGFTNCGSAVIYHRNTSTGVWEFLQKIFDSEIAANDKFGFSVSISGNFLVVGAPYNDQFTSTFTDVGAYVVFKLNEGTGLWSQVDRSYGNTPYGYMGYSVSISGDYLAVGNPQASDGTITCGKIFIFKRNVASNIWDLQSSLYNNIKTGGSQFGHSVAISDNYLVVGSPYFNGTFTSEGHASIFKRNAANWTFTQRITNVDNQANANFGRSVSISENHILVSGPNTNYGAVKILKKVGELWLTHQYTKNPLKSDFGNFGISVALNNTLTNDFLIGAGGVSFFGKIK